MGNNKRLVSENPIEWIFVLGKQKGHIRSIRLNDLPGIGFMILIRIN